VRSLAGDSGGGASPAFSNTGLAPARSDRGVPMWAWQAPAGPDGGSTDYIYVHASRTNDGDQCVSVHRILSYESGQDFVPIALFAGQRPFACLW